ncbi:MAG TPA: choice-of-anchor A family protein [Planctomycetota bacterium]|nr:choice-of-anchor A family protein [Planctomycetota bacterium]
MIINALAPLWLATLSLAPTQDLAFPPGEFNVFSCRDIRYTSGSDIQGIAGCARAFDVASFSLHSVPGAGPGTGISLYCGGDARIGAPEGGAAVQNGGLEVQGRITIESARVSGSVWGGGDAALVSGVVIGDLAVEGSFTGNRDDVHGEISEGASFEPTVNLTDYAIYYRQVTDAYAAIDENVDWSWSYGQLTAHLNEGLNVIEIDRRWIEQVHTVVVDGPAGALLAFNVSGQLAEFGSITWILQGGVTRDCLALNFYEAKKVIYWGGEHISILAPYARVTFIEGVMTGNLIAGDLRGVGQVNAGAWCGFYLCPPGACPGTAYCGSNPNSTGATAAMDPTGSSSYSANDLELRATGLPAGQFGMFFFGTDQTAVPFGNGVRCVDGDTLYRLGMTTADGAGLLSDAIDFGDPDAASAVIQPAQTWHFQAWYRDPADAAPHFNSSDAYTISFTP